MTKETETVTVDYDPSREQVVRRPRPPAAGMWHMIGFLYAGSASFTLAFLTIMRHYTEWDSGLIMIMVIWGIATAVTLFYASLGAITLQDRLEKRASERRRLKELEEQS
jgi:hypothetical protein